MVNWNFFWPVKFMLNFRLKRKKLLLFCRRRKIFCNKYQSVDCGVCWDILKHSFRINYQTSHHSLASRVQNADRPYKISSKFFNRIFRSQIRTHHLSYQPNRELVQYKMVSQCLVEQCKLEEFHCCIHS